MRPQNFNIASVARAAYWKEYGVNFVISLDVFYYFCGRKQRSRK
jgi:hypothetical protein